MIVSSKTYGTRAIGKSPLNSAYESRPIKRIRRIVRQQPTGPTVVYDPISSASDYYDDSRDIKYVDAASIVRLPESPVVFAPLPPNPERDKAKSPTFTEIPMSEKAGVRHGTIRSA